MAGTKAGGLKARESNKARYGDDFYKTIGRKGGAISTGGGFAKNPELAKEAGRKGGTASRKNRDICVRGLHPMAGDNLASRTRSNGQTHRVCLACEQARTQRSRELYSDAKKALEVIHNERG